MLSISCISIMLLISIMAQSLSSPILLTLMIIMYMIISSVFINLFSVIWQSYALIIIFLGGMLILFIYLSSLSSSEKIIIFFDFNYMLFILFSFSISFMMFFMKKDNIINSNLNIDILKKLYLNLWSISTIIITFFLLLSLLSFVKLVEIYKGPLKMQ